MASTSSTSTSTSSGNEGSRGSRGIPNSGAQEGTGTNEHGDGPSAADQAPDTRQGDARGGGGAGSGSRRSADEDSFQTPKE